MKRHKNDKGGRTKYSLRLWKQYCPVCCVNSNILTPLAAPPVFDLSVCAGTVATASAYCLGSSDIGQLHNRTRVLFTSNGVWIKWFQFDAADQPLQPTTRAIEDYFYKNYLLKKEYGQKASLKFYNRSSLLLYSHI